eukprot:3012924-Rhodomonas_salina.3
MRLGCTDTACGATSGNVQPEAEATMSQLIVDIMAVPPLSPQVAIFHRASRKAVRWSGSRVGAQGPITSVVAQQSGGLTQRVQVYDGWHQLCADAHRNTKVGFSSCHKQSLGAAGS